MKATLSEMTFSCVILLYCLRFGSEFLTSEGALVCPSGSKNRSLHSSRHRDGGWHALTGAPRDNSGGPAVGTRGRAGAGDAGIGLRAWGPQLVLPCRLMAHQATRKLHAFKTQMTEN